MMRLMRGIAPWIMVIVALSFVGWMVFDVGMDVLGRGARNTQDEVARVNGTKISLQTYYAALRNAQDLQRRQAGTAPQTLEEQRALEDQVMDQLVQQVLLQQEYRRRGIKVTDDEVRQAMLNSPPPEIQRIPEFQTDSQFDLSKYQRYLQSRTDPQFVLALEARYREEIPQLKLLDRVTSDVYVSDAKLWRIYRDHHDSVTVLLLALVPQLVVSDSAVQVTEADVQAYYRDHQDEFKLPERAFLSFVAISRLPDARDTAAALARAQEIHREILDGADFATVAKRESADSVSRVEGGDLGESKRGSFVRQFEEAAFALRPGQVSEPVLSPFGYHIIKVESREGDKIHVRHILIQIEVHGEHLEELDARADSLDLLAAEREDPAALDSAAAHLDLSVIHPAPATKGDPVRLGRFFVGDAGIWAFETEPGHTSPVFETDRAFYVFRLDSLVPEHVPPLTALRPQVVRAATLAKQLDSTRVLARTIESDLAGGTDLSKAATRHGLTARPLGPFTRTAPPPVLRESPAVIGVAFGLPIGRADGPIETDRAMFFVEPIAKHLADSAAFVQEADQLRAGVVQQAREARAQQVFSAMRKKAAVVDRRRDLERAQRTGSEAQFPGSPLGF